MTASEARTMTVLVTDMAGSTAFRAKWGDEEAEAVRREHTDLVRAAAEERTGALVKSTGDGALATFASTTDAIAAAIHIQQESIAQRSERHTPSVRIGLAAGEVTLEDGDCFGRPVIEASRLESKAIPDGILATKVVEALSGGLSEARFVDRGTVELKGFPDPVPVSEVRFDLPDSVAVASDAPVEVAATRLAPPRLASHAVERPRVTQRLQRALEKRIAVIEAGAGYGKSTAAVGYLLQSSPPWCWVSCDGDLVHPLELTAHVCGAISKTYPGFGLDRWPEDGVALALAFARQVKGVISDPVVVCVDDVHLLSEELQGVLLTLVEEAPEPLRWLLLSRRPVDVPSRAALATSPPIREADLAFNRLEAQALISDLLPESDPKLAERIYSETEGWAAGLVLSARAGVGARASESDAPFDYLAAEALDNLDEDLVDLLERVSLPHRFNAALVERLTGRSDAEAVIAQLIERHLFTIALGADEGWFRFHHLFRAYLKSRLESRTDVDLAQLNVVLAKGWLAQDDPEEAVRCYLAAEDYERAAETLEPLFAGGIIGARYAALRPLLEALPAEVRGRHPDLVLAEAAGHLYDGRHEHAYQDFERSIGLLVARGLLEQAAAILTRYFQAMITAGTDLATRMDVAGRLLPEVRGAGQEAAAAQISGAAAYGHATETRHAARLIDEAVASSPSEPIVAVANSLYGYYVAFPEGRIDEALSRFDAATMFVTRRGDDDIYSAGALAVGLKAAMLPQIGQYEQALVLAQEAEAEAVRRWGSVAGISRVVRWWRLGARIGMGDVERAEALVGDPSEVLTGRTDLWSYRLAAPYARLAALRGDAALTRRLIRHGREALRDGGPTMDGPMVLCEFSHAANAIGFEDLRRRLALEALQYAIDCGLPFREAHASMHCAAVEGGTAGEGHLDRALELTQENGYEFLWTLHERELSGALLGRALASDRWRGFAAELGAEAGDEVARRCATDVVSNSDASRALLEAVLRSPSPDRDAVSILEGGDLASPRVLEIVRDRPRAPLSIRTYGELSVARAGRDVNPPGLLPGARPAALLAQLTCVWPADLPAELRPHDLAAVTEELNQILDPWSALRDQPAVQVSGHVVRLILDRRDQLDFAPLLEGDEWSDMDLGQLRKIERQTTGEFLTDYPNEKWAASTRQRLARARGEFLIVLAERLRAEGQPGAAADRLNWLADRDPEREELHRRLMRCYVDAGEPARALRQFHICRTLLLKEHGIEPSAETRRLFEALV